MAEGLVLVPVTEEDLDVMAREVADAWLALEDTKRRIKGLKANLNELRLGPRSFEKIRRAGETREALNREVHQEAIASGNLIRAGRRYREAKENRA